MQQDYLDLPYYKLESVTKQKFSLETKSGQGPFVAGILLSALNPFFIIWWLTIGLVLISESIQIFGIIGIVILFLFHIWMDYAWLFTIATFSSKAKNYLSKRNFKIIIIGLSIVLIYFGIEFSIKIITNYLEISISIVETLRVLPSRDSNASEDILTSDIL